MRFTFLALVFTSAIHADDYEFPKGFPLKAAEVEWYTPTEWCQNGGGGWKHVSSQSWNREIPWINAGLHRSPNAETYKFRKRGTGRMKHWTEPAIYFADGGSFSRWAYPEGTVFGELIRADGEDVEIFTLEFKDTAEPVFHRWRPFGKRSEIEKFIVRENLWRHRFLDAFRPRTRAVTGRGHRPVENDPHVIDVTGLAHEIELSQEGIDAIRARPWRDVIDVVFSESESGLQSYSFTTKQRSSIVPVDSEAGLFSSKDCLQCHRTAGAEGRLLDPVPRPDKYGNIRGGGFVFSLTPGGR